MLKYLLVITFFVDCALAISQKKTDNSNSCTVSKLLFVGANKQKKILISKLHYNQFGLLVKEQNFSTEASHKESQFYYKDSILYLIKHLNFDMSVSKSNLLYNKGFLKEKIDEIEDGIILKNDYEYDKNGNLVQQLSAEFRIGCLVNQSLLLVSYYPTGKKSEELLINNQDTVCRTLFIYNDNDQIIKKINYYKGKNKNDTQSFEYDNFGNLIKKIIEESGKLNRVEEYIYENNRLVTLIVKDKNGEVINTEKRFYNELGLIRIIKVDSKFNKKEIELYERGQIKEHEFWEENRLLSKLLYDYGFSKKHNKK